MTKTKELEDKLNTMIINKDNKLPQKINKIVAVSQLDNNKKSEIKKVKKKIYLNPADKKINKHIIVKNVNKKPQKVEVNKKILDNS